MTSRSVPTQVFADRIAVHAERTPDRIAITWTGGAPWTYGQLVRQADAIAGTLLDHGIARGELVGICMPRRPEMAAAALGVMRAGAGILALDPVFPLEQLAYMASHGRLRHLLVWREADVPGSLASGRRCLELCDFDADGTTTHALPEVDGEALAYTMFTSGSTGKPKGVRTLHRNLAGFLESAQQILGINANDVAGAFSTLAFDSVVLDLYLPLFAGARVVLATETDQDDPAAAAMLRREHRMTTLFVPPAQLRLLRAIGRLEELRDMSIWSGGEALPRDLAEAVLPNCRSLWNLYGPTETTVASTMQRVTHGSGPVPIGTPIANASIYILDDTRIPVAAGTTGEIWIGGAGVADGYLHDPALSAERFLPDPFAADGSHMYRTGDLGALHDGVLYFHGRIDHQIKLNGFRIEPGEVESAALAEPGIHQAVAVAHDTGDGDQRLILYVVADPAPDLAMKLRAALRARLPAYIRLHHIETLDTLPLTPNGKVDRKALPLPQGVMEGADPAGITMNQPIAATTTPVIATRHDQWSPLVPLQPHGKRPPLFFIHALGGNVLNYAPLARGLDADQPVYGIQALGLDGITPPIGSLPIMAACYVAEIQRVQPHGPYFLSGGSMGGLIAYEIAQQLHEQGESIGLLAMIDTYGPDCWRKNAGRRAPLPVRIASSLFWKPLRMLDALRVRRARSARCPLPHSLRYREIERVHYRALVAYEPQPYAGGVVLFRVSDQPDSSKEADTLGWTYSVRGDIEVVELPGNHDNLIEQPELLRQLRRALERAQAPSQQL